MSKAKGIDVSTFQGKIDWDQVKGSGKVGFAMLRMGYGNDLPEQDDVQFERNVSEGGDALGGLPIQLCREPGRGEK